MTNTGNSATNGEEATARAPRDTAALLKRMGEGVSVWDLEVRGAWAITPTMRRLRCTAPELAALSHLPGQDLMLTVPTTDGQFVRRRYTIRSFDPANATIDIDVVLHGDGPGATWAAALQPGTLVEAIGPRGKVTVDPSADWHLFAGDDSAIPASLAIGRIPGHTEHAVVVLEVDGAAGEQQARHPRRATDLRALAPPRRRRPGIERQPGRRTPIGRASQRKGPCLPGRRARGGCRPATCPGGTWPGSRPDLGQALLAGRNGQRLTRRARAAIRRIGSRTPG